MIVLDTDHLTVLSFTNRPKHGRLTERMRQSSDQDFATTIVNAEEQMRGWLAEIHGRQAGLDQVPAYERLLQLLHSLNRFRLSPFDPSAATEFGRLRSLKLRIGTMDQKIACIALVHGAMLLSNILRDFRQVPGLRVESWLDEGDED